MAWLQGLKAGFFYGVCLEKAIEQRGITPAAFVVIEVQLTLYDVNNYGIEPTGKLYFEALDLAAEELRSAMRGLR